MHEHGFVGRIEWAIAGRAQPGQPVSGDRGIVLDTGGGAALFAVVDGLGHGTAAAHAAEQATRVLTQHRTQPLDALMVLCHRALAHTRGAAISLARFDRVDTVCWLGVGNVESQVLGAGPVGAAVRATMLLGAGVVGDRLPATLRPQSIPVRPGDLLLMATDGIVARSTGEVDLADSASGITTGILALRARTSDDALVLAARHRGVTEAAP
ncbi:SpoIIE family protein phosphatase [Nocardia sp. CNY236]|uniref:SpoIIE family protein phosphatase n=1 Tax=Nocardia sp. CNY236 TaxID=1169152 RepID=UPI000416A5B1|nr:SpoIIE family protein phosphatase [Nocardia sp. CNY236]